MDSLEQKRKLAELLLEKQAVRQANPLKHYQPLDYQTRFHGSTAKIRLFVGTNRCGKTTAGIIEAIQLAAGTHPTKTMPVPNKGRIIGRDFPNSVVGTLVPKFKEWVPEHYLKGGSWEEAVRNNQQGIPHLIYFANGSIIQFMSGDQDVSKFESFDTDWMMFDEPPREEIYDASTRGLVDRGGIHWFVLTPINCAWIYERIYEPITSGQLKDADIIHGDAARNPHIDQTAWAGWIQNLPEDEYQARARGAFSHLTGAVFKDFIREVHVIDPLKLDMFKKGWPGGWPVIEAIDPHVTGQKPHAVLWLGIDKNDNLHVFDYLSFNGTIQELGEEILKKRKGRSIIQSMSDDSLNQEVDRQNQYNLLCLTGVRPRLAKKKNLVIPGINYISTLFKERRLYIWDHCLPVIRDFKLYMWNSEREGEPIKKNDDYIDCLRYALESSHTFNRVTTVINTINSFESYGGGD